MSAEYLVEEVRNAARLLDGMSRRLWNAISDQSASRPPARAAQVEDFGQDNEWDGQKWVPKAAGPVAQGEAVDDRRSLLPDNRGPGLYRKFKVTRTDGSHRVGGKHEGCEYFVLDVDHDKHAMPALAAYAESAADEYPQLAADLRGRYNLATQPHSPDAADSGRIGDEMVEAGCRASYESDGNSKWEKLLDCWKEKYRKAMRAALEAALAAPAIDAPDSKR
jgi:hypothetical protein